MADNSAHKRSDIPENTLDSGAICARTGLSIRNLSHEFVTARGSILPVIKTINAEVAAGETIAIVGVSGSGKTTFLNLVAGRLEPTSGQIHFNGSTGPRAPGSLGMVFQQPSLLPWRSLWENIALPLELVEHPIDDLSAVQAMITSVGLSGFEHYLPGAVSGGMQSRAALARALVTSPDLLLMDEPFGALDEMTAESLNIHLSELLTERAITTLLVTHQLAQAVFLADRVWVFGNRPARIIGDVLITASKPRSLDFIDSEHFARSLQQVRSLLRAL